MIYQESKTDPCREMDEWSAVILHKVLIIVFITHLEYQALCENHGL